MLVLGFQKGTVVYLRDSNTGKEVAKISRIPCDGGVRIGFEMPQNIIAYRQEHVNDKRNLKKEEKED